MSQEKKLLAAAQDKLRFMVTEWGRRTPADQKLDRLAHQLAAMRSEIDTLAMTIVNMPDISAGGYLTSLRFRLEEQAAQIEKELGVRLVDGKLLELRH